MVTIFVAFILLVPLVIGSLYVQRWLFKDSNGVYDPEWELYQQQYD